MDQVKKVQLEIKQAIVLSLFIVLCALGIFASHPAHAQFSSLAGGAPTMEVISKGNGAAEIVIKGIAAPTDKARYCLTGTKENWAGIGGDKAFDMKKMACGEIKDGVARLPITIGGRNATLGFVPIVVNEQGARLAWGRYPAQKVQFQRGSDLADIIGLTVEQGGAVRIATSEEAKQRISD